MDPLKQPQLGQMILSLRQEKKFTQEELVERCNLNVRTLQRIEAGEVTPRDYTIKSILTALDYDFEQIELSLKKKTTINRLQMAWIAGITYFAFGLFETAVDFARFEIEPTFYFPLIYTGVKAMATISFVFFMIGFVEVGKYFQSFLLKISAFLMIGSMIVIELYDIISIFSDMTSEEFIMTKGAEAVAFGGVDLVFGIALFRLGKTLGTASKVAGIFEIILGAFFITFVLAFIGLILLIPATILEIILLYKCYDLLQSGD